MGIGLTQLRSKRRLTIKSQAPKWEKLWIGEEEKKVHKSKRPAGRSKKYDEEASSRLKNFTGCL